jgi:hypothetical protein
VTRAAAFAFVLLASALDASEGPRLAVEPAGFDFGRLREGATVSKTFVLRNVGSTTLSIEKVSKDCGCTVVEGWKERLAPGEATEMKVALRVGQSRGRLVRNVIVKSNDSESPLTEVKIQAEIVAP